LNFDLPPTDPPSESDSNRDDSDASSTDSSETAVVEEAVYITVGQTLGSQTVVFTVVRVVAGGSHVICKVRESLDDNYMEGSEKVLAMAIAIELYQQYHNS
jgi:hypothetical protein